MAAASHFRQILIAMCECRIFSRLCGSESHAIDFSTQTV